MPNLNEKMKKSSGGIPLTGVWNYLVENNKKIITDNFIIIDNLIVDANILKKALLRLSKKFPDIIFTPIYYDNNNWTDLKLKDYAEQKIVDLSKINDSQQREFISDQITKLCAHQTEIKIAVFFLKRAYRLLVVSEKKSVNNFLFTKILKDLQKTYNLLLIDAKKADYLPLCGYNMSYLLCNQLSALEKHRWERNPYIPKSLAASLDLSAVPNYSSVSKTKIIDSEVNTNKLGYSFQGYPFIGKLLDVGVKKAEFPNLKTLFTSLSKMRKGDLLICSGNSIEIPIPQYFQNIVLQRKQEGIKKIYHQTSILLSRFNKENFLIYVIPLNYFGKINKTILRNILEGGDLCLWQTKYSRKKKVNIFKLQKKILSYNIQEYYKNQIVIEKDSTSSQHERYFGKQAISVFKEDVKKSIYAKGNNPQLPDVAIAGYFTNRFIRPYSALESILKEIANKNNKFSEALDKTRSLINFWEDFLKNNLAREKIIEISYLNYDYKFGNENLREKQLLSKEMKRKILKFLDEFSFLADHILGLLKDLTDKK